MARQVRVNAMSFSIIVRLLTEGPVSYDELSAETGLHRQVCGKVVSEIKKQGRAYLCEYAPDSRGAHVIKMFRFTLTPKKDVPRPPRQSRSVSGKKARAKLRALRMNAAMAGQPMTYKEQRELIRKAAEVKRRGPKKLRSPGLGKGRDHLGKYAPAHKGVMA